MSIHSYLTRSIILGMIVIVSSTTHLAEAAVLEVDLLAPGDKLLTRDLVNRRDWLDLSQTQGLSYNSAVALTNAGQPFEGFVPATRAEVETLALSAGIDISTEDYATNEATAAALGDLLSITYASGSDTSASGWLSTTVFAPPPQRDNAGIYTYPSLSRAGAAFNATTDSALAFVGTFLHRASPNVPEPSTFALAALGLLGLGWFTRRRKR